MNIAKLWSDLSWLALRIQNTEMAFNMRRRMNPHHPKADVKLETDRFNAQQREDFFELKRIYTENREALLKELPKLSDKLKQDAQGISDALEKCIADDVERTLLADPDHIDP